MPAPQANQADNSMAIIWIIVALFAGLAGLWFGFKKHIVTAFFTLKYYEVHILNLMLNHRFDDLQTSISAALANPDSINFIDLVNLGSAAGSVFHIPFAIILCVLGIIVYFSNTAGLFRNTYTMKHLAKLEQVNWPQISPVIGLDLIKTDIDTGPWAMAMTPIQFCKRHKLLEEIKPVRQEGMARSEWDRVEVVLKSGEANKLFALQLGPLWRGTKNLPPYIKALFAVFAARINADSKAAANLLAQLSVSSTTKLNCSGMDELCQKHEGSKLVLEVVRSHAYVTTVMASMLEKAREDGVQASVDFLWLKTVDRRLWYILNTVGRQTPFVEVAGIFAHWVAEKEAGKKLIVPMVEEATKALDLALKDVIYRPDEA